MPKDYPPIPEEMPNPGKEPEIKEPEIIETPDTPDESPVVFPEEEPMPDIPDEVPPPDTGGFTG